jgi:hypothetical protein
MRDAMHRAFVIQFHSEQHSGETFRGRAEHVSSGRTIHFQTLEELVEFFAGCMNGEAEGSSGGQTGEALDAPSRPFNPE